MGFLKRIFTKQKEPVQPYQEFWNWFRKNERAFFNVVKDHGDIEEQFFSKLSPKLDELKDGFWYQTGMFDDDTVELIITADGKVKNIPFVEDLISAAPLIEGWKFTALSAAVDIKNVSITTAGYQFDAETVSFYAADNPDSPDEIDITLVHASLTEADKAAAGNGFYIFLDNYLGELNFAVTIDNLRLATVETAESELIPVDKLKDYLMWRQREFVERYEGARPDTEDDEFNVLEAEFESGNILIAVVNTALLHWDGKASHPWILSVEIPFSSNNDKGMPDEETSELLNEIEDKITTQLKVGDGCLYIGRQTTKNVREIYFACKDFRKPSRVLFAVQKQFEEQLQVSYDIYKDKYWKSFDRLDPGL